MSTDRLTARPAGPPDASEHLDIPENHQRHGTVVCGERRGHLEALCAAVVGGTSFIARVVQPTGTDFVYLRVVNFEVAKLAEDIGCRVQEDRRYWFTWSWGEPIRPADDLDGTVAAIKRVLDSGD
jgi:hypothetical protein